MGFHFFNSPALRFDKFKLLLILMLPKDLFSHHQSTHLLKVRRVCTYNHPSHAQSSLDQSFNQDLPYFKANSQLHSEGLSKKGNFISALINKIKSVERPQNQPISSREVNFKKDGTQVSLKTSQKMSNLKTITNFNHEGQRQCRLPQNSNPHDSTHAQQSNKFKISRLDQLELQNSILREKLHELLIENEKHKLRFNKMSSDLKQKEEKLLKREEELNKFEADFALRQQLFSLDSAYLKESSKKTQEELLSLSFSNIKLSTSSKLSCCRQVNESIFPMENAQLAKAGQQVKQLQMEKLQMEKKFTACLSQYRKKKEDEIERMKRSFTSNLTHYKDLLLKVSFKPALQAKKYQEDTFETVILQTSSADQS